MEFAGFVVVVVAGEGVGVRVGGWGEAFGEVDGGDLEVVVALAGGVGADQEAVDRVGLVWGTGGWEC